MRKIILSRRLTQVGDRSGIGVDSIIMSLDGNNFAKEFKFAKFSISNVIPNASNLRNFLSSMIFSFFRL